MKISEKIRNFIVKLQALPEAKKKIVFFSVMAIVVLIVGVWGFFATKNNIGKIGESVKNINLPKFDMPQDSGVSMPSVNGSQNQTADSSAKDLSTADWKTYANTEYGFEIKYPKDWSEPTYNVQKKEVSFNGIIVIHYYKNEKELTGGIDFNKWINENSVSNSKENIIIPGGAGLSAIKIKKSYCNGVPLLTNEIFTQTNFESFNPNQEPIYTVTGPIFECGTNKNIIMRDYDNLENIFNGMISTLKFIYIPQ